MGKVVEKVRIVSVFDRSKAVEVDAVIDTGATMVVLPQDIVDALGLMKIRDTSVRYANNRVETKTIYGVVAIEVKGRTGDFDVLAEVAGTQPLIGQVVLETLDLVVEPRSRSLTPNPASPDLPMVEIL